MRPKLGWSRPADSRLWEVYARRMITMVVTAGPSFTPAREKAGHIFADEGTLTAD